MECFWDAVARMFDRIRDTLRERSRRCGIRFDEDLMNETIDRCEDKYEKFSGSDEKMLAYLWAAFRTNAIRELGYKRNDTDEIDECTDVADESDSIDDMYREVSSFIRVKYGEDAFSLFFAHANGMRYEELPYDGDVGKLKYLFRKIREDVRGRDFF